MILHQERFEAWLFAQPRDRRIEPANGSNCFLCSFVKETTNLKHPGCDWSTWYDDTTTMYSYLTSPDGKIIVKKNPGETIPAWARKLINGSLLNECATPTLETQARVDFWGLPMLVHPPIFRFTWGPLPWLFGDPRTRPVAPEFSLVMATATQLTAEPAHA